MFSEYDIQSSIDKGTKTMSQKMRYEGKNIIFKRLIKHNKHAFKQIPSNI